MWKNTKVVAYEGMRTGTSIFYKCEYEDEHCNILSIRYPLPSLKWRVSEIICGFFMCSMCEWHELVGIYKLFLMFFNLIID